MSPGLKSMAFAEHRDDVVAAELGDDLHLGAGRLDHLDLGFGAVVGEDEMLRPDAVDRGATVAARRRRGERQARRRSAPSNASAPLARIVPLRKFIAGEPMKPATNRFSGRS